MNESEERVALVTGGTRGIGAAISTRLAQHGARIAAVYHRDTQTADAFAKEASNCGQSVSLHQANVGNPGDCQRVVREVLRQYGRIDYLVNNAGAVHDRTAVKMSPLDWEQVIRVNLSGPFFMSQAVLPHFLERGFGRIVMISSYVGQVGRFGQANYAAAKSGQFGLTKALALETAAKGITVNCVVPGAIKTDMVSALPEDIVQAVIDTIPMHALGTPEDVAEAVRYLVSDEAHYLTGALIPVAGGLLMM
jgi:NAD(P)-dependent dehydrogenase (short-subunit alcohol dehydrogenase family)